MNNLFNKHYVKGIETGKVYEVGSLDFMNSNRWIIYTNSEYRSVKFNQVIEATEAEYNAQFEKKVKEIEKFDIRPGVMFSEGTLTILTKTNELIDSVNTLSAKLNALEERVK